MRLSFSINRGRALLALLLAVCVLSAKAQHYRTGKLGNGLTYYLCHTDGTPGQASYYVFQNVGAVLEADDQQGMAHLIEHQSFNVTTHFPQGVMTFLRANGLLLFDAHTGMQETVFSVKNVPLDNATLTGQLYDLMADWCHGIQFSKSSLDKDRQIVLQELAQRGGVERRLTDSIAKVIFGGSLFSRRNIIGTPRSLRAVTLLGLRRFYDAWYRPDLQFVAVIGDIDLDKAEKEIAERLGAVPAVKACPLPDIKIKPNAVPLCMRFVDRENKVPSFGLYQRIADNGTEKTYLYAKLFNTLAPRRFARLRNEGADNFISASVSLAPLIRGDMQNAWDMIPYGGKEREALRQMVDVREDIKENGFGQKEFEKAKWDLYENMKNVLDGGNLGTPDNLFDLFRRNFLEGTTLNTVRDEFSHSMQTLVELERDSMNAWIRQWMNADNLSFVTYSQTPEEMHLTKADLEEALGKAQAISGSADATTEKHPVIIPAPARKGKITKEEHIEAYNAYKWVMDNGATVYYKQVPSEQTIYFAGSAKGGRAAVEAKCLPDYLAMRNLIMQSGIADFDRNALQQWLADKDFDLNIDVADYSDGIGGHTPAAQAEDFFKYVHNVLARQNFSQTVFEKYIQRKKYLYMTRSRTGMDAVQNSINELVNPWSAMNPKEDTAFFNKVSLRGVEEQFREHFCNVSAFNFCLVGDLSLERARELATTYIGSLPSVKPSGLPVIHPLDFSAKAPDIRRSFTANIEGDVGEVEMTWISDSKLTNREKAALQIWRGILENRFFDVLREKEQATYTVGVKAEERAYPLEGEVVSVHFSTSRNRAEAVMQKAKNLMEDVSQGKFSNDEFKQVQVNLAVNDPDLDSGDDESLENHPLMWMARLNYLAEEGKIEDNSKVAEHGPIQSVFETIKPEDVKAVVNKVMRNARYREFIVKSLPHENRQWERVE